MRAARLIPTYPQEPNLIVDGADFDGSTNVLNLAGGNFVGDADSKSGILSFWARIDGGDGAGGQILKNGGAATARFLALKTVANKWQIVGKNTGLTTIMNILTSNAYLASAAWLHILASWDLATAGKRSIYVNDVLDFTETTFTNDTIAYTDGTGGGTSAWNISGTTLFNGVLAELWFAEGQYLDFSLVSNRRKFISANGKPVYLGADGSIPLGVAPIAYQHLADGEAVANFATNRGSGGNWTISGTLATGSTSPSD